MSARWSFVVDPFGRPTPSSAALDTVSDQALSCVDAPPAAPIPALAVRWGCFVSFAVDPVISAGWSVFGSPTR